VFDKYSWSAGYKFVGDTGKPIQTMVFTHFLLETGSLISGIRPHSGNLFARYQMIGFPLSTICSGRPIDIYQPHFWF
jgi:hypothetical protein